MNNDNINDKKQNNFFLYFFIVLILLFIFLIIVSRDYKPRLEVEELKTNKTIKKNNDLKQGNITPVKPVILPEPVEEEFNFYVEEIKQVEEVKPVEPVIIEEDFLKKCLELKEESNFTLIPEDFKNTILYFKKSLKENKTKNLEKHKCKVYIISDIDIQYDFERYIIEVEFYKGNKNIEYIKIYDKNVKTSIFEFTYKIIKTIVINENEKEIKYYTR